MIQISSFSPLDNLARRSWVFDEEYILARTKSLTVEIEDEIKYEDIRVIQAGRAASLRGVWGAFVLLAVLATTHWLLGAYCQNPPILQSIEKVGFFLGLVIMIPSFRKIEMYSFRDLDREPLMYIPVRAKDRQAMAQAIAHVRQRTTLFSERGPNDPLPADQPIFELTDLNIPDFLSRSTTKFYNDRLLDVEKSLVEETVTEIMYSELIGKTRVIRVGNAKWDYVWSYWLIFVCMMAFSIIIFFPQLVRGNTMFFTLFLGSLFLLIPMFLMRYVKRDLQVFYNPHNRIIHWIPRTPANRENLDQIVEFIQERISQL